MQKVHCCQEMEFYLEERKVPVGYLSPFRRYYIKIPSSRATQNIHFCPWCGSELPKDITDTFYTELSKILNINEDDINLLDKEFIKNLPKEFRSDQWWKKRGL